jgi:hypothetical protein
MPLGGSLGSCGTVVCAVEPPSAICRQGRISASLVEGMEEEEDVHVLREGSRDGRSGTGRA